MMTRTPCAGMPEQAGGERTQLVRGLGGRPDGEFLGGGRPLDDHAARLHRHRDVHLLIDVFLDDMGRGGEQLLVRRRAAHPARDVVGVGLVDDWNIGGRASDSLAEVGDAQAAVS